MQSSADNLVPSRLTREMMNVIKGDKGNPRGQRTVTHGDLFLLVHFQFNKKCNLNSFLLSPYDTSINRETGIMIIDIPQTIPDREIRAPNGSTHFRLKAGAAAIDFDNDTYSVCSFESDDLPLTNSAGHN